MFVPSITCDNCGKHDGILYCFGKDKGIAPLYFHEECIREGVSSLKDVLEKSTCNPCWESWDFDKLCSNDGETCKFIDPTVEMQKPDILANIKEHQMCISTRTHYFSKDTSNNIINVIVTWDELFVSV